MPSDALWTCSASTATKTGSVELPADVFDVQANIPLMHQVVVAQLAAARQGTHKAKTRGEVAGGGRKPYKQKGTGRARQGSIRAPQFTGGGVVHGPVPRDYASGRPKKMKAAALRGALSDRAREGRVHVVESFVDGDTPKTKAALATLPRSTESGTVLVVLSREDEADWLSLRNAAEVHLLAADQLNTYDVLVADEVVFTTGRARRVPRACPRRRGGGCDEVTHVRRPARHHRRAGGLGEELQRARAATGTRSWSARTRTRPQIKIAIEQIFDVRVLTVNTLNREGKRKRTRNGWGKRKDTKRAMVKLADGDRIDAFGGPVS